MAALREDRLVRWAGIALVRANLRYWSTVAPTARRALRHWERRAERIRDPSLRELALEKLREEGFNAEVAATLATLAPLRQRARLTKAIVALEVLYDYLDGLGEAASQDPLRDGRQLHRAFTDALTATVVKDPDYYRFHSHRDDDGYLQELAGAVRDVLLRLPSRVAVTPTMERAAVRCCEAQVRAHAVTSRGVAQLEEWAKQESELGDLDWREFLAGAASSVLAVHALLALASDEQATETQADAIDGLYHAIGVLSTMLDSVVDRQQDAGASVWGYINLYDEPRVLAESLAAVVRHVSVRASETVHAAHHLMTAAGVVAYYGSAPAADEEPGRVVFARLEQELGLLSAPTLTVMRGWRLARKLRAQLAAVCEGRPT